MCNPQEKNYPIKQATPAIDNGKGISDDTFNTGK
jgi:hypothetical protein